MKSVPKEDKKKKVKFDEIKGNSGSKPAEEKIFSNTGFANLTINGTAISEAGLLGDKNDKKTMSSTAESFKPQLRERKPSSNNLQPLDLKNDAKGKKKLSPHSEDINRFDSFLTKKKQTSLSELRKLLENRKMEESIINDVIFLVDSYTISEEKNNVRWAK